MPKGTFYRNSDGDRHCQSEFFLFPFFWYHVLILDHNPKNQFFFFNNQPTSSSNVSKDHASFETTSTPIQNGQREDLIPEVLLRPPIHNGEYYNDFNHALATVTQRQLNDLVLDNIYMVRFHLLKLWFSTLIFR